MPEQAGKRDSARNGFSTFGGVFTPCVLTILGVIMYLRLGQVVGRAGVLGALLIVLLAASITFLTSLSLSAIATNTRVKGGGPYFLISRTLGAQFGAAIGIVFYLAQAVAVALYVIGFAETVAGTFGFHPDHIVSLASLVNGAVFVCVYIGAGWTIRVQYGILAVVVLSLLSFFAGALPMWNPALLNVNLGHAFEGNENFIVMFALFFPAVTGMTAGANMSGDLKEPGRSIPLGTLSAVGATTLVYLAMVVVLGAACPREGLLTDTLSLTRVAWSGPLITAGIFAATLSSALGSMMGAPRILQAFAQDNIFTSLRFFARGSGRAGEPRRAILLTFGVAQAGIMLGDLNAIAPVITMAFLITYGTLNLATFYESITHNPSYRPRFRYCHWSTALAGALGCLVVMFLIAPAQALVAIITMALLYYYVGTRKIKARWGDLQHGVLFERVRKNLVKLEALAYHPKNWRPIILALSGGGWDRPHIAVYGYWFTAGNGILSLGQIITGDIADRIARRDSQELLLRQFIQKQGLEAFPAVVVAPTLADGIESLVQCYGIGMLRPNTVLTGWPSEYAKAEAFFATMRNIIQLRHNVVCVRLIGDPADPWAVPDGTIDVWWRGKGNGPLMLLFAYLLSLNPEWRDRPLRLMRVVANRAGEEGVYAHLSELIQASRIPATPGVIVSDDPSAAIVTTSSRAALVILGFDLPEKEGERQFYAHMEEMTRMLPRCAFVYSAGGMELDA